MSYQRCEKCGGRRYPAGCLRCDVVEEQLQREENETPVAKQDESMRWAARCGMVQGERDVAIAALANIARNVHDGSSRQSIARDALKKLSGVYFYCPNCGGAHPRDPKIDGCQEKSK